LEVKDMNRRGVKVKSSRAGSQVIRGNKVPVALLRQWRTAMKPSFDQPFREKSALRQNVAAYIGSSSSPAGKEAAGGLVALRHFTEKLANRRVDKHTASLGRSSVLAGQYVVSVAPPYGGATQGTSIISGSPAASASADEGTGQMNVGVVSNYQSPSEAWALATLLATFVPPFGGSLRASANLSLLFSRWVNAIQDFNEALSEAVLVFGVLQEQNSLPVSDLHRFELWRDLESNQLDFDFGSQTLAVSAQLDVESSSVVVVGASCSVHAKALGWPLPPSPGTPRSLAGSKLGITWPSVTLDLLWRPVISA
jgi:hypothetical protein